MTVLLGKYTLFACANLYNPTTRLRSYFLAIFAAHLCVYTRTMGCKRNYGFCSFDTICPSTTFLVSITGVCLAFVDRGGNVLSPMIDVVNLSIVL